MKDISNTAKDTLAAVVEDTAGWAILGNCVCQETESQEAGEIAGDILEHLAPAVLITTPCCLHCTQHKGEIDYLLLHSLILPQNIAEIVTLRWNINWHLVNEAQASNFLPVNLYILWNSYMGKPFVNFNIFIIEENCCLLM